MIPGDEFPSAVRRALGFLVSERGFRVVSEGRGEVWLESDAVAIQAVLDPRGEVDVRVSRLGSEDPHERWTYTGMVGRASVERLLEIAGERMRAEEPVLRGEAFFYKQLGHKSCQRSKEWTDYYSRKGPRPRPGPLP